MWPQVTLEDGEHERLLHQQLSSELRSLDAKEDNLIDLAAGNGLNQTKIKAKLRDIEWQRRLLNQAIFHGLYVEDDHVTDHELKEPFGRVATPVADRYTRSMSAVPARDLRNHTAEILRRVEAGEEIEVFRDNRPVAKIIPLARRRQWLPVTEIASELAHLGADTTGFAQELRETLPDTTDDLPW